MRVIVIVSWCILLVFGLPLPGAAFNLGQETRPEVGREFPDFTLPDADGREVSISDFRGKVIMLSFWSCYTDTCFTSVRIIEGLIKDFSSRGLVAPTVCSEIPPALEKNSYAELIKRCGVGQIILIDAGKEMKGRLHIRKFPTTFLIGRDFLVRETIKGVPLLMREEFREAVRALVEEEDAPAAAE